MALAALSGLKIALGPAFLATSRRWPSRQSWIMAAMGEMVLDKLGVFPPRYRLPLLIPHSLAGAWVARESLREDGEDDPWAAVAGAMVAAGVAVAAPDRPDRHQQGGRHPRRPARTRRGLPGPVLRHPGPGRCRWTRSPGAAREMFDDVRERARPALESMGMRS